MFGKWQFLFLVCDFDGIKIGIMICYDREYPESARVLMLQGAEIILVPNDCGSMKPRLCALSTRAYENMVGVAMANPNGEKCRKFLRIQSNLLGRKWNLCR